VKPITFRCLATLPLPADEYFRQILDLSRWPEFPGYGPIPGIQSAVFELRTAETVGSIIRVTNRDGSTHRERIVEWVPPSRLHIRMEIFSPPLSRLATGFDEVWQFEPAGDSTRVTRNFAMHPVGWWTKPALWLISLLLRRAIAKHLRLMAALPPR
jgi:hypothetical protein